ncbi:hypothetical protein Mgra_00005802 [Meloidogyne graminicola]|uniref:Uncharacterized protein n=1 Tax=Meloidogyne graminicola TaxID=189291 RepID=A0A8S9ZNL6_9BILA|nr:hypothetical protein Mgra_00005802 [Meloidogyne graminicola]
MSNLNQQTPITTPTPPPAPPPTSDNNNNLNNNLIAPLTTSSLVENLNNNKILNNNNIKEYNILLIGIKKIRQILYDQLRLSAQKYEQHNHYDDISYLTFELSNETSAFIELMQIDPRTTRTGAHLMAIRKAHAAIICYAAHIPSSFHALNCIAEDFSNYQLVEERGRSKGKGKIGGKNRSPTSLLLCDNDVLIEEDEGGEIKEETKLNDNNNKPIISRLNLNEEEEEENNEQNIKEESPKINTNNNQIISPRRHPSMEKIVKEYEEKEDSDWIITKEKGEQLSQQFGPDCQFKCFSFSSLKAEQDAVISEVMLIEQLINRTEEIKSGKNQNNTTTTINTTNTTNIRRLSPLSSNLKKMLQGGSNQLKGSSVVQLITRKKNSENNNEEKKLNNKKEEENQRPPTTSIFGNAFRAITQPREFLKQKNNKISSTIPLTGNVVDIQEEPNNNNLNEETLNNNKISLITSSTNDKNNFNIVQIEPPTGETNCEPFEFKNEEKGEEEEEKFENNEKQKENIEEKIIVEENKEEPKIEKNNNNNTNSSGNKFKLFSKQSSSTCIIS